MTPDELNSLMQKLAEKLGGDLITPADTSGTPPEIAVVFEGVELVLTADVL